MASKRCTACNGTGKVPDPAEGWKRVECGVCNGTGKV